LLFAELGMDRGGGERPVRREASARRRSRMRLGAALRAVVPRGAGQGVVIRMPGTGFSGMLPALSAEEAAIASEMRRDVGVLAGEIGDRNVFRPAAYTAAREYLEGELRAAGHDVRRQEFGVQGYTCVNLEVEVRGTDRPEEIVVVGAHYDSVSGCPAANDNGSGVAAVLALARRARPMARTVRYVLFANEEPPFFWTEDMGSWVYAKACRGRDDKIVGMITPETIGCYSDEPGSQRYPLPSRMGYSSAGNFIMFVGMYESRALVRRCVGEFRRTTEFPCHGVAASILVPFVGASDHWGFWKCGYPSLMVTDTAPLRYRHYHMATDTPEKVDYERAARVVGGIGRVAAEIANGK
jgi:hypothetical protein